MSAKLCKYGCGQILAWDNDTKSFKEQDGTPHTRERCEFLKKKPAAPPHPTSTKPEPKQGGTKQVAVILNIPDEAYNILNLLCEYTDSSQQEYLRHTLLESMRGHLDVYVPGHAKLWDWKKLLDKEASE